jgi:hypothetical protein
MTTKFLVRILLIVSILGLAFAITIDANGCGDEIRVIHNNKSIDFSQGYPQMWNGRVLLPVRSICNMFKINLEWDSATNTVTVNNNIKFTLDSNVAVINGNVITMDTEPLNIDGRIFLPARVIVEAIGKKVGWNSETRTMYIFTETLSQHLY